MRAPRQLVFLALLSIGTLALAACGSSGAKSSVSSAPPNAATANNDVMTANSAKLGTFLVDDKGSTLYTLTNAGHPVSCTGACATIWPPLLLPSGMTTPTGAAGVNGLGAVSMNGGMQVTDHGDPLYHYSGDMKAGDTNGQGINSFGGIWNVVRTSTSANAPAPTQTPTTSSSSGGYGGY